MNRHHAAKVIVIMTIGFANGCFGPTVRATGNGRYMVTFQRSELPGKLVNRPQTVPAYLKKNRLVPGECLNGVGYIRGGDGEGGWGWAEVECR